MLQVLREEDAVAVPTTAIQVSQTGNFVFVVKDGVATVQHVNVERQVGSETVVTSGLKGGETVVTDGQLLLSEGTHVAPRNGKTAETQANSRGCGKTVSSSLPEP